MSPAVEDRNVVKTKAKATKSKPSSAARSKPKKASPQPAGKKKPKPEAKVVVKAAAASPPHAASSRDGQKRGERSEKPSPFRKPIVIKDAAAKSAAAEALKSQAGGKHKPVKSLHGKTPKSVAAIASAAAADANGYVFINGRRVRMISAKGLGSKKPRRGTPSEETAAVPIDTRPAKSRLQRKDLDEFRALLLAKRTQLVGDLSALEDQALQSSGGDLSHMPIHMADIGTDTYDQDFMLGMAAKDRELIREIDDALKRIDDGTYGVCSMTGKLIPKARLNAKPWAKYTVEAARQFEQGRAT